MLIIKKDMWSYVVGEDPEFLERLKNRLTLKPDAESKEQREVQLFKETIPGFALEIPTGVVDSLVLPYVRFSVVSDERKEVDIDVNDTLKRVNTVYKKMSDFSKGFEVREHQTVGTLKSLMNKHGICEAATGCFVGSTLIMTDIGFESIKDLTNNFYEKKVFCSDGKFYSIKSAHFTRLVKDTLKLRFNDGVEVECTPEHKFLLTDGSYTEAINLLDGKIIAGVYGDRFVCAARAIHYIDPIPVYDIEVDCDLHNFTLSNGVIVHNSGKTEIIVSLLELIPGKILVINNRTNILNQIEGRARARGITRKIEYLNKKPDLKNSEVIVSTNNLIWNDIKNNKKETFEYLQSLQAIIVDECHHGVCQSIALPALIANPEYLIGFTASPFKENGQSVDDIVLNAVFGNSFYYISSKYLRSKGYSSYIYAYYINYTQKTFTKYCRTCTDVYKHFVAENFNRNEVALRVIKQMYNAGLKVLVMVSRIEHGNYIVRELKSSGIKSLFMKGKNQIFEATEETEKVKGLTQNKIICHKGDANFLKDKMRNEHYNVIVGNVVFNEGIDVPEFDAGILLDAGKNVISHLQRIGRVCRRKENGINAAVFVDFNDTGHPILEKWVRDRKEHLQKEDIPIVNKSEFDTLVTKLGSSRLKK